jgi:hypothetical protein
LPRILRVDYAIIGRKYVHVQESDQARSNLVRVDRRHGRSVVAVSVAQEAKTPEASESVLAFHASLKK